MAITELENVFYGAKTYTTCGRERKSSRTSDVRLDAELSVPVDFRHR